MIPDLALSPGSNGLVKYVSFVVHMPTVIDGQHYAAEDAAFLLSKQRRQRTRPRWLKALDESDRQAVGQDLMRAQWRWPVGMPLCRAMGQGLWEIRTELPS